MAIRHLLALTLALAAGGVLAQEAADPVVDQLRAQGYVSFEVSRTLLGRVRILAVRPEGTREIVYNPSTGEILRDLWEPAGDEGAGPEVLDRHDDGPEAASAGGEDRGPGSAPRGGGSGSGEGSGQGSGQGSGDRPGRDAAGDDDGAGEDGDGGSEGGGDGNRGHGNDDDGFDDDNPGGGNGRGNGRDEGRDRSRGSGARD